MDFNRETVLDELNDFEKRSNEISPILEDYLLKIAKSGDTMFSWGKLKPLFKKKLELVLNEFYESCPTDNLPPLPNVESFKYEHLKAKIIEAVDSFQSAPFTIQRLCELVTEPRKHYKRTDKFMRGIEKNVLVVSTIEPKLQIGIDAHNNNNNNNPTLVVNGLIGTTTNSPHDSMLSDDNENTNLNTITSTLKSSINGNVPLDNFANVFTSVPCMTTPTDVHISSISHGSLFDSSESSESYIAGRNGSDVKVADLGRKDESQLPDSVMDTSPDPPECSSKAELFEEQQSVDLPHHSEKCPVSETSGSAHEICCNQPSAEEPSSSGVSESFLEKPFSKTEDSAVSNRVEDSLSSSASTSTEIVSCESITQESEEGKEMNAKNEKPSYVVTSSQDDNAVPIQSPHEDDIPLTSFSVTDPSDPIRNADNFEASQNVISSAHCSVDLNISSMDNPSTSQPCEESDSLHPAKRIKCNVEAEAMEQN